ncbi:hypothetical protein [Clostridium sp.]|uniref:hypothetical protein n=1 Tax=Clostridium sp. TaxID=1506 RepID=UPI0026387172|nr:hypothetical protein [Clostridium sp.]
MKAIIIECNPSKNSFSEIIKEKIKSALEEKKKSYDVIALSFSGLVMHIIYNMSFFQSGKLKGVS